MSVLQNLMENPNMPAEGAAALKSRFPQIAGRLKGASKGAIAGTAPPSPSLPMTARLSMSYGPGARLNRKRASPMGPKGFAPGPQQSPKFGEMVPSLGPPAQLPYRPQPYQGAQGMGGFGIPAPMNTGFSGIGFPGGMQAPQPLPQLQPLPFQGTPRPFADPATEAGEMPGVYDPRKPPSMY